MKSATESEPVAEKVVQFLVCPQIDFIGTEQELRASRETHADGAQRAEGAPQASLLHVGWEAVKKLRGDNGEPDLFVETVSALFNDKIEGTNRIFTILDEDWHPKSCAEFEQFGTHCVKGSAGARLPEKIEEFRWHRRMHVIRANSINIATSKDYGEVLKKVCGDTKNPRIKAGVIGVWTHVKVDYLLLNLQTHWPCFKPGQLAVCEPLCASPNRDAHNAAINKFRDFDIKVYDDVQRYLAEWLALDIQLAQQAAPRK